jgi:AraC family transcriptional regulator
VNRRFIKSIEYVETHLNEPLSIESISDAAHLSRYHYSRLFRTLTNESVMGYVRKRRLSNAAQTLASSLKSVTEVAYDSGFDSPEAFTRAFKRMFDMTPSSFRESDHPIWVNFRHPLNIERLTHLQGGLTMEPTFKSYPEFKAAGLKGVYTPETNVDIPMLWDRFNPLMDSIPNRVGAHAYGLCVPVKTPEFEYYAAVQVDSFDGLPADMLGVEVEAQDYAVFTHKGSLDNLRDTMAYIWGTWLPESKFTSPSNPDFELYGERFNPTIESSELDIYIPVVGKV